MPSEQFSGYIITVWVPVRRYLHVCGHVTVFDHRLSKPEGFNVSFLCLYVVVNIANEHKKLQTPADIIPLYARKI